MVYIMTHFFTHEAAVPVRGEPAEPSEMVTQLLFGEKGIILASQSNWCKIQCDIDQYEGWVDAKMILPIEETTFESLRCYRYVTQGAIMLSDHTEMHLPLGARIPLLNDREIPLKIQVEDHSWHTLNSLYTLCQQDRNQAIAISKYFLNTPYLWGGRGGFGVDCSGMVQTIYRMCGIYIPRDASQQARLGEEIPFGQHQPGDLAFFTRGNSDRISHVGMVVSSDTIIHASGKVKLDFLEENGIINVMDNTMTHSLVFIKRC